ncbi:TPA: acyltransferase, partial [Burkholderia multivorans]|nr:acyltransferase [Burkholderia multivorans]HEM7817791.1 acyltransferase [Burkholderia multivorans]HEM7823417.1 acyltransferase [Burkholderia multivorans]HEM7829148.1 acyltransferase [Burkholderia multivorans]
MNPVAARPIAPSTHSGVSYRPDIDGLRAVAVSLVVLFHAFPSLLPGGFVGVDIFFVISGYLIGSILLTEFASGSFTYRAFYARRIRRIFPALLLVLVACYAFGWFELLADEFKQLGAQVAGGAGFVSNVVLWKGAGYFATQAEKQPLLHLWSLGVEEQFYIVLPIAFWIAFKFRRGPVIAIALLWIASFVANIMSVQQHPVAAF